VAVAHSILVITWHLLTNDADYTDLGGDYFTRHIDNTPRAATSSSTTSNSWATPSP